jgi:hypothetical protein
MPQPKPGEFDHRRSQTWVTRLRHALLAIDVAALPRRGSESRVEGDLPTIVEVSEQTFGVEYRSELGANSSDP